MESFCAITRADVLPHATSVLWDAWQGNSSLCLRVPSSNQASAFLLGCWQRRQGTFGEDFPLHRENSLSDNGCFLHNNPLTLFHHADGKLLATFQGSILAIAMDFWELDYNTICFKMFLLSFCYVFVLLQQWSLISALPVTFYYGLIQIRFTSKCPDTTWSYTLSALISPCYLNWPLFQRGDLLSFSSWIQLLFEFYFYSRLISFSFFCNPDTLPSGKMPLAVAGLCWCSGRSQAHGQLFNTHFVFCV